MAILEWLELSHPEMRSFTIKIDNEGKRKTIVKNGKTIPVGLFLAKRMGLHPRASDLFFAYPLNGYHGLWMEVKPDKWKPRGTIENQRVNGQMQFIEKMKEKGYYGEMVIGTSQGIGLLKRYLTGKC